MPAATTRRPRVVEPHAGVVACLFGLPVVRDDVVKQRAAESRLEEAELVAEQYAALGHRARRDRVVVVGRDVPVKRRADVGADRRAQSETRRQESGAALVADREPEDRRGEDRHALEVKPCAAGTGRLFESVDFQRFGLDPPGVVARRTGRETGIFHAGTLVAEELDQRGVAATIARRIGELCIGHRTGLRVDAKGQFRPGKRPALLEHARIAFDVDLVGGLRVGDAVTTQHGAAAPHLGVAFEHDLLVDRALDALGAREGRRGVRAQQSRLGQAGVRA